ncbi:MAG: hypothetical protein WAN74_06340 [Thermoplasmata archaeon]
MVTESNPEPHLVGYRTYLPKGTGCLVCKERLAAGALVIWIYVEQHGKPIPGTSMFGCLTHDADTLKRPAIAEIKRRADAAEDGRVQVLLVHDEGSRWRIARVTGNPRAARKVYEAAPGGFIQAPPPQ